MGPGDAAEFSRRQQFCTISVNDGIEPWPITPGSPNSNPSAERWSQSAARKRPDHFNVDGKRRTQRRINVYLDGYQCVQPHRDLHDLPIGVGKQPAPVEAHRTDEVVCHKRLCRLRRLYDGKAIQQGDFPSYFALAVRPPAVIRDVSSPPRQKTDDKRLRGKAMIKPIRDSLFRAISC